MNHLMLWSYMLAILGLEISIGMLSAATTIAKVVIYFFLDMDVILFLLAAFLVYAIYISPEHGFIHFKTAWQKVAFLLMCAGLGQLSLIWEKKKKAAGVEAAEERRLEEIELRQEIDELLKTGGSYVPNINNS